MNLFIIVIQFIFAIPLFLIINYFESNKDNDTNNINHIIIPSVYIIILSALFASFNWHSLNNNIFMIVVFELIIRLFYVKTILNRDVLVNNKYYFTIYLLAILSAALVDFNIIAKVDSVVPSIESILPGLWLLIIIFIYFLLKDKLTLKFIQEKRSITSRMGEYIVVSYARLKNKYHKYVNTKNNDIKLITYSIMIYENYKNPLLMRKLDNLLVKYDTEATELGIMQIKTNKLITDEESIKLAVNKITKIIEKEQIKKITDKNIEKVLQKFKNNDIFIKDVSDIYRKILGFEEEL